MIGTRPNVVAYIMPATSISRNWIPVHYPAHYIEGVYILFGDDIAGEFPADSPCP